MSASKRTATNDKTAPIKQYVVTEDIVAIVDSISNWVAEHSGKSANIASIIDISVVSAVGSLIHSAVNHNALPVENDGVDKLATTINNALSHNTITSAENTRNHQTPSARMRIFHVATTPLLASTCNEMRVAIHNWQAVDQVAIVLKPSIDNVSAPIGMTADDDAVAVKQHVIVKYSEAVVNFMSHRVTINNRTAINVETIVDIAAMNAVVAFIKGAVYDDAASVKNYGVLHKKLSTINNSAADMDVTFHAASKVSTIP